MLTKTKTKYLHSQSAFILFVLVAVTLTLTYMYMMKENKEQRDNIDDFINHYTLVKLYNENSKNKK